MRVQAEVAAVEFAVFDAIIQGHPDEIDFLDRSLFQIMSKTGVSSMGVVKKGAVTINVSLDLLVEDMSDSSGVE